MKLAVIGYGYWGPNLVRNFTAVGQTVKYIIDSNPAQLAKAEKTYPSAIISSDVDAAINDPEIDAVAIALPVRFHYEIAKKALLAGKHVMVEKPMTSSGAEADELIELAVSKNLILMPDHTFLYTGAVRKIKSLIESGELGDILYFDSVRVNLGLFQADVNVLWDLAPHDISILSYVVGEKPKSVSATGKSHGESPIENIAYLTMHYDSDFIAHATASWVSPVKLRTVLIGGTKKMIVYDDNEPTEKIKVYDSGFEFKDVEEQNKFRVDYRVGDIYIPKLEMTEALALMAKDFVEAVESGGKHIPVSDMHLGALVVKTLEAAEKSIKQNGAEVSL